MEDYRPSEVAWVLAQPHTVEAVTHPHSLSCHLRVQRAEGSDTGEHRKSTLQKSKRTQAAGSAGGLGDVKRARLPGVHRVALRPVRMTQPHLGSLHRQPAEGSAKFLLTPRIFYGDGAGYSDGGAAAGSPVPGAEPSRLLFPSPSSVVTSSAPLPALSCIPPGVRGSE